VNPSIRSYGVNSNQRRRRKKRKKRKRKRKKRRRNPHQPMESRRHQG
jgi:hypothetical protein